MRAISNCTAYSHWPFEEIRGVNRWKWKCLAQSIKNWSLSVFMIHLPYSLPPMERVSFFFDTITCFLKQHWNYNWVSNSLSGLSAMQSLVSPHTSPISFRVANQGHRGYCGKVEGPNILSHLNLTKQLTSPSYEVVS